MVELLRLFEELVRTAAKLGVDVRVEELHPPPTTGGAPRGGLCVLRGRRVVLVDERGALPDRIATLARALSTFELDHLYVPPVVRATIGAHAAAMSRKGEEDDAAPASPTAARPLAKAGVGLTRPGPGGAT
jgi:hypothetical protein